MKNNKGTINGKQLNTKELEIVNGGNFLPNDYSVEEYRRYGRQPDSLEEAENAIGHEEYNSECIG